jgi:hypothetical protein
MCPPQVGASKWGEQEGRVWGRRTHRLPQDMEPSQEKGEYSRHAAVEVWTLVSRTICLWLEGRYLGGVPSTAVEGGLLLLRG